jgi:hypothetical protein
MPVQAVIADHLATYKEFPKRQRPADFNMEEILKNALQASARVRGRQLSWTSFEPLKAMADEAPHFRCWHFSDMARCPL